MTPVLLQLVENTDIEIAMPASTQKYSMMAEIRT